MNSLVREITAASVEAMADVLYGGGPGSGRHKEFENAKNVALWEKKLKAASGVDQLNKYNASGFIFKDGESVQGRTHFALLNSVGAPVDLHTFNSNQLSAFLRTSGGIRVVTGQREVSFQVHAEPTQKQLDEMKKLDPDTPIGVHWDIAGKGSGFGSFSDFEKALAGSSHAPGYDSRFHQKELYAGNLSLDTTDKKAPTYPPEHKAAMRVPKGGSSCASCEYVSEDKKQCGNEHFIKWNNGSKDLPYAADEYCSDWYEPADKEVEAGGPGSGRHPTVFHGGEFTLNKAIKDRVLFTSPDKKSAKTYADESGGKVITLRSPVTKAAGVKEVNQVAKSLGLGKEDIPELHFQGLYGQEKVKQLVAGLRKLGYDGADLKGYDMEGNPSRTHIIFDQSKVKEIKAATETSLEGQFKGTLWNGIKLIGFTGPEEEGIRAMMSRIPPELFFNVKEIKSAKELNAKHGKFVPETQTVLLNPRNFKLRQRFGQGDGWLYHPELTVVHEVGHSIYESWSPEEKQKWQDVSGWQKGWEEGQSLPYQEVRKGWEPGTSEWTIKSGTKTPRHYSTKNPNEHFADCFAYYILGRAFQMSPECKEFLDKYFQDHVKNYTAVSIQSPTKAYLKDPTISVLNKDQQNLYNIHGGGPGSGRHPYGRKEKPLSQRAQRAKETYVAQTKSKSRLARVNEGIVAQMVGGNTTGDNKPFDVLGSKFGIEVKTLFPGVKNEKITMHPESLVRKTKAAKELKVKPYTVAIDMRDKNSVGVYFKQGLGSFRLGSMKEVSFKRLKEYIQ